MKNIAIITDLHLDEAFPKSIGVDTCRNLEVVLHHLKNQNIDTIIIGGDIGESHTLELFFSKLTHYNLLTILGNHDSFDDVSKFWKNKKSEGTDQLFYSIDEEFYRLIFMDSSSEEIRNNQLRWMDKQLNTEKTIMLFVHHPVVAIDTPIDKMYALKNRETIISKFQKLLNKVIVFSGHYHMAEKIIFNNITQYITPAISYQVNKNAKALETTNEYFGYRIIKLNGADMETEVVIIE